MSNQILLSPFATSTGAPLRSSTTVIATAAATTSFTTTVTTISITIVAAVVAASSRTPLFCTPRFLPKGAGNDSL